MNPRSRHNEFQTSTSAAKPGGHADERLPRFRHGAPWTSSLPSLNMTSLRALAAGLLSKGVLSTGWYSILTGLALVIVGLALASVSSDDPAADVVGLVFFLLGAWQTARGLRSEFQRRPSAD